MIKSIITLIVLSIILFIGYSIYDVGFDFIKDYIYSNINCNTVSLSSEVIKVTCKLNSYTSSEIDKVNLLHNYMTEGYKLLDYVKENQSTISYILSKK